jgi:hypothetical protein
MFKEGEESEVGAGKAEEGSDRGEEGNDINAKRVFENTEGSKESCSKPP